MSYRRQHKSKATSHRPFVSRAQVRARFAKNRLDKLSMKVKQQ